MDDDWVMESDCDTLEDRRLQKERERSRKRREDAALEKGDAIHIVGRHCYLNSEEELELVMLIRSWPDVTTQPTVAEISTLVCFYFFLIN
jgi:hypothetical protein